MQGLLAGALATVAAAVPAVAVADTPLGDPSVNHELSSSTFGACDSAPNGASCLAAVIADIDKARAAEGVGPISVPTNWATLTVPQQLLVVASIERVDRGLAPVSGLASALNIVAQTGADNNTDPVPVAGLEGSANWAGGYASPLEADFGWMYDDGLGSPNLDCTPADQSGCWGHRHDTLGIFPFPPSPGPPPVVMGAAETLGGPESPSMAEVFEFDDSTHTPDPPLWATLAQSLPIGVSASSLTLTTGSPTPLQIWASGENMNVTTSISSGFGVSPTGCNLTAGTSCTLNVSSTGAGPGSGTLTLTGPNGNQTVALSSRAATGLSLTASGQTLVSGQKLTLTGKLTTVAGGGVGGQSVTLSQRPAGSGSSSTAATGHTSADGSVTFKVSPKANTSYTLSFAGTSGFAPSTSSAVTVGVSSKITVHAKHGRVSGKVSPSVAGERVKLQRRHGRRWKSVASAKLGRSGTFSFTVAASGHYRIVAPASASNAAGTSATFTVS